MTGITTLLVSLTGVEETGGVFVEVCVGTAVSTGLSKVRVSSRASPGVNTMVSLACVVPIQKVMTSFTSLELAVKTNLSPNVPPSPIFPLLERMKD